MRKKYNVLRFPEEVKMGFIKKKIQMENTLKKITKKDNVKLKMTDVMRFFSQKPAYVYNDELLNYFMKNKKKSKGGSETLIC